MTEAVKREIRDWVFNLVAGMVGGMVSSGIALGWVIHVYH